MNRYSHLAQIFRLADCSRIQVNRLGDEIIITDDLDLTPDFPPYFLAPITTAVIVEEGTIHGRINLIDIHVQAPSLVIFFKDDILEFIDHSEQIKGKAILMSDHFTTQLNISSKFNIRQTITNYPIVTLNEEAYEHIEMFFSIVKRAMQQESNPNRLEIIINLTRALYYGAGYYFHHLEQHNKQSREEILVNKFVQLVHEHCHQERGIEFYARKMCLSPKYVANVVSQYTHKPASKWIQEHVILKAKTQLSMPDATVAEVADALHFSDQSTFGKYFHRYTGLSPKAYQKGL